MCATQLPCVFLRGKKTPIFQRKNLANYFMEIHQSVVDLSHRNIYDVHHQHVRMGPAKLIIFSQMKIVHCFFIATDDSIDRFTLQGLWKCVFMTINKLLFTRTTFKMIIGSIEMRTNCFFSLPGLNERSIIKSQYRRHEKNNGQTLNEKQYNNWSQSL